MPDNKKHHYVPKFYLKRFSRDGKSIGLYNLNAELKIGKANLKNQCYQDYFYGKDGVVEKRLSAMEGEISNLLKKIDASNQLPSRFTQEHVVFTIALLAQHGRTKYNAEMLQEMQDKMLKHVYKEKMREEFGEIDLNSFEIRVNNPGHFSLGMTIPLFPMLLDLDTKLILNKTPVEFVTSDTPVIMINTFLNFRREASNTGLSVKGLQVFYPLSPNAMAILYDSRVYRAGNDHAHTIEITNERDVYELNALQCCSCFENIYFRTDNQNLSALHKKTNGYRRSVKSRIKAFSQYENKYRKSEIVINHKEDIHYIPSLSFMNVRKNAKKWREQFKKMERQPAMIFRDEEYHRYADEFVRKVSSGELENENILRFLREKYEQSYSAAAALDDKEAS